MTIELEQRLSGITAARIRIPAGSAFDTATLGETKTRTRTGVSIVAVVRAGEVHPSPVPDFRFRHDDLIAG